MASRTGVYAAVTREAGQTANPKALDIVRKVAALGVACMERHGAPVRR